MFIVIDVLYVAKLSFFMLVAVICNLVLVGLYPSDNVLQQTETKTWTESTILRLVVLYMWTTMLLIYFFW